jgi:hypothetical protein
MSNLTPRATAGEPTAPPPQQCERCARVMANYPTMSRQTLAEIHAFQHVAAPHAARDERTVDLDDYVLHHTDCDSRYRDESGVFGDCDCDGPAQLAALRSSRETLLAGLTDIIHPMDRLQRHATASDGVLNGNAHTVANSASYLQDIARETLAEIHQHAPASAPPEGARTLHPAAQMLVDALESNSAVQAARSCPHCGHALHRHTGTSEARPGKRYCLDCVGAPDVCWCEATR